MDRNLRYEPNRNEPKLETLMDFSSSQGILREAEKCNGSGDCRKLPEFGGTMCPSYRATRNEKDTTRARANALREYLTNSEKSNRFDHEELKEVFEMCLSCKACASECPSSVDVAALKAEFQHQYYKTNGIPIRTRIFAHNNSFNKYLSPFARIVNWSFNHEPTASLIKRIMGIANKRSLPNISNKSLYKTLQKSVYKHYKIENKKKVYLFIDEFTNYLDRQIGEDAVVLLQRLGYDVQYIKPVESGRAMISKGLLPEAKRLANLNIKHYKDLISEKTPLVGIEPSAIFSFKDEYQRLADNREAAKELAKHCYLIEEFIQSEIENGAISADLFTSEAKSIKFHGHCHQKALGNQKSSFDVLNLPKNYKVTIIPSGCCGMAGSFGYEKEHYQISMTIGGQTLFPAINKSDKDVIIAANGTSCRHQILDGTGRIAKHPVSILKEALL
jgi:Fe-S oxidoreductase